MNIKQQQGATLIVALVILTLVTLLGVAGMRGTALEMKMIASARDKAVAFEAVEATLSKVEAELKKSPPKLASISTTYTSNCAAPAASEEGESESPAAAQGFCFTGSFDALDPYRTCTTYSAAATSQKNLWEISSTWSDNAAEESITLASGGTIDTKYIVEFMCFTLKDRAFKGTVDDKENGDENIIYMPLFRITAFAEGTGKRAKVFAQTTVKVSLDGV